MDNNSRKYKAKVIAAAKKMLADKKAVVAYSKGEISKKQLSDSGVKLDLPIRG